MTTLTVDLPEQLANDVQKFGTLESEEFLQLLESLTHKFKTENSPHAPHTDASDKVSVMSILDRLSAPALEDQGLSDIDFDIPKANIKLKEVDF